MDPLSHSARLVPFQPETVWILDGADLVERRGPRERRFPLSALTAFRLAKPRGNDRHRALTLVFGRRHKLLLPSQSWTGPGRFEDRLAGFSLFARAVAAVAADLVPPGAPGPRFELAGGLNAREGLTWMMGLLGLGTGVLLLLALTPGMAGVAIALAARMAFLLLLLVAVLPWLDRGQGLDPHALPDDLLPAS
ncbi:MAG: hypothetical protein J7515_00655 [Caulobacter sp.]|nr:hypothetical protein [Caulobacter sp.]